MPGGDRTGPAGQGPMTGRAVGYCAGAPVPGYINTAPGRGIGRRGRGFRGPAGFAGGGRALRRRSYATGWGFGQYAIYGDPSALSTAREDEMELLREQVDYLNGILEDLKKRIEDLSIQEKES